MNNSTLRRIRIGAGMLGISVAEYAANVARGLKWCCFEKHWVSRESFGVNLTTGDTLSAYCRECASLSRKSVSSKIDRSALEAAAAELLDQ